MGFIATPKLAARVESTKRAEEIDLKRFDAIVVAGGQGPTWGRTAATSRCQRPCWQSTRGVCHAFSRSSEREACSDLHDARIARETRDRPECGGVADVPVRQAEVHRVEDVENVPPQRGG